MASSDERTVGDPLLRTRRSVPSVDEDRHEHQWWNTNADLVERIWANDTEIRQALRAQYLDRARAFLTEGRAGDAVILELGCGSGWVGRSLVRGTKSRLLGIDISETQVEIAARNAEAEGLATRCAYIAANLSDVAPRISGVESVSGLVIHAILHHLTWSEIDRILTDAVGAGPAARLFAYEPVFFRQGGGKRSAGLLSGLSRALAVSSALGVLLLMRLYGRIVATARDPIVVEQVDRVSKEAAENQWVLSPKEIVFEHKELLGLLGKNFRVKQSYLCNYIDMNAAGMAAVLRKSGREKRVFLKFFLPTLSALDRWLVSSGAIYGLCNGGRRSRLIDQFFPRFCFWGVECLPK